MSVVPSKQGPKIEFFENHIAPWNTNATALGLTTAGVTNLQTKTSAARVAYAAQQVAYDEARAKTTDLDVAMQGMASAGAQLIDLIRAKAKVSGDSIYALAQIPSPGSGSPRGNPGTPFKFKVVLQQDGSIVTTFKCDNPGGSAGTLYQFSRKVDGEAKYSYVGGSGVRKFVDASIPAGSAVVAYKVQAVRSTAMGSVAEFSVNFGTSVGGGVTATLVEARPFKLAA